MYSVALPGVVDAGATRTSRPPSTSVMLKTKNVSEMPEKPPSTRYVGAFRLLTSMTMCDYSNITGAFCRSLSSNPECITEVPCYGPVAPGTSLVSHGPVQDVEIQRYQ